MKYLSIFLFCAIILGIISADDENKVNPTTHPTEQGTQTAFPSSQNTPMSIPKVVYLKNLFEMNCLKEIMENSRLKNRSVNNQEKREFVVIPNFKNNPNRPSNSNKRYTNVGASKNNPMQDKFLLIPSKLGTKYVNFQNKKEINSPKFPQDHQKRLIHIRNHGQPAKTLNKKEITKNRESQKLSPPVSPQTGLDRESIKTQQKVIEDVAKLTNKGVNKLSNPTTTNNPRVSSNYKIRVTTRAPSVHSYEVEEVIQEDINVDINKENEKNPENEEIGGKKPQKPTMDDIKANIFEIINKLLNSDFDSKVKESEDVSKANKKSKLDENLWKEGTKKQNPSEKPPLPKQNTRPENQGENKEMKNSYQDNKNEKFGRKEKPNNNQNPKVTQGLPSINLNNRRIQATPRVQIPGIYTPRNRQNIKNSTPPPKAQGMNTRNNFSNPRPSQFSNGRSGKVEKANAPNINKNIPIPYMGKNREELSKRKEIEKSMKILTTSPSPKTVPTTTENVQTSFPSSTASGTLIKSFKFFSKTTVKNPEDLSQEVTEIPVTVSVLEETTEIQAKKEEGLKNSRKMNFGTQRQEIESGREEVEVEKDEMESGKEEIENGKKEIDNSQDQRRSDILIEEDIRSGIGAMEYISKLKSIMANVTYDSLSAKALVELFPLVIDDLRNDRIIASNLKVLIDVFGKYWTFLQDLAFDANFDMMTLVRIKDKKDFEQLYESYYFKESEPKEEEKGKTNSDDYDYVEEYKEMYKDLFLQELEDSRRKLRAKRDEDEVKALELGELGDMERGLRAKRDEEDDLRALEATREYFESVQEEENEIDYLYEDLYSDALSKNKDEELNEFMSLMDFFMNSQNSSKNIFNL